MDSTGNIDHDKCIHQVDDHCATVGVPVGSLLTSETQSTIDAALRPSIHNIIVNLTSFNGSGVNEPCITMSYDCDAERNAYGRIFLMLWHYFAHFMYCGRRGDGLQVVTRQLLKYIDSCYLCGFLHVYRAENQQNYYVNVRGRQG